MTVIDTERLSVSTTLWDLACEYRAEAWRWADIDCRVYLLRCAIQSEAAARRALHVAADESEAIATAAIAELHRIQALRHFIEHARRGL